MRICVIDDLVSVNLVESMLNCNLANSIYIINEGQYKEKNFSISHGTLCTALLVETLKKYNCENLVEIIFYSIVDEKGNKSYANLLKGVADKKLDSRGRQLNVHKRAGRNGAPRI